MQLFSFEAYTTLQMKLVVISFFSVMELVVVNLFIYRDELEKIAWKSNFLNSAC